MEIHLNKDENKFVNLFLCIEQLRPANLARYNVDFLREITFRIGDIHYLSPDCVTSIVPLTKFVVWETDVFGSKYCLRLSRKMMCSEEN